MHVETEISAFRQPARKDTPSGDRANPTQSALAFNAPHFSHKFGAPVPGSVEYYCERYPGFPLYVNEAFSIKARGGDEALKEFYEEVGMPGIETRVDVEDEVTKEIVQKKVVVNWF